MALFWDIKVSKERKITIPDTFISQIWANKLNLAWLWVNLLPRAQSLVQNTGFGNNKMFLLLYELFFINRLFWKMSENPYSNPCTWVKRRGHSLYPYSGPSWAFRLERTIILLYQMVHNWWEPNKIGQKEHFGLVLGYKSVRRLKKTTSDTFISQIWTIVVNLAWFMR